MNIAGFVGPTYQAASSVADAELSLNWFPERNESAGAVYPWTLVPRPGSSTFCSMPTGPGRALFEMDGRCFAVGGGAFYEIFQSTTDPTIGTVMNYGAVATDQWPATISSNGDGGRQLGITSGGNFYVFDLDTSALTLVKGSSSMASFLDGYFVDLDVDTSTFHLSDLENGLVWPALDFAQRTAGADRWLAMGIGHREIWLWGSQTAEVWYNAGTGSFPMAPISGAFLEQGIASRFGFARIGGSFIWLSRNNQGRTVVVRANGYQPVRISTHAIEYAFERLGTVSDAVAFGEQYQGHEFFVLNFLTEQQTWAYDATEGLWHQRDFWDTTTGASLMARAQFHASAFGLNLVCDDQTGDILRQDVMLGTDAGGAPIRCVRRAPTVLGKDNNYFITDQIEAILDVGVSSVTSATPNQIVLRCSDDNAKTWSNERWAGLGAAGEYQTRVVWNRCGRSRHRIHELTVTGTTPIRISALLGEGRQGIS